MSLRLPIVPASFFGMVLGLAGLVNMWRTAHRVWGLPAEIGEGLAVGTFVVWAIVVVLFAAKWIVARDSAIAEAKQPVQCCFIGLAGAATTLAGLAVLPYARTLAVVLIAVGGVFSIGFAAWRAGLLWQGDRDPAMTTPVLYLPSVSAGYVTSVGCSALGAPDWAQIIFGMGLFSWFAIESVLVHRLYTIAPLPPALRPTLGIQLAPAPVGAVSYLAFSSGPPDWFAHALVGYGIAQLLILMRLLPWIREQPFAASYWSVTFGLTALAAAPLRMIEQGETGDAIATLAPVLFVFANVVLAVIIAGTLWLVVRGRLLGAPTPTAAVR